VQALDLERIEALVGPGDLSDVVDTQKNHPARDGFLYPILRKRLLCWHSPGDRVAVAILVALNPRHLSLTLSRI
jgi:hypothetical protein